MSPGPDDFANKIRNFSDRVKNIGETKQVPLTELMVPAFMKQYTDLETFEDLITATGLKVETAEEFLAIPNDCVGSM